MVKPRDPSKDICVPAGRIVDRLLSEMIRDGDGEEENFFLSVNGLSRLVVVMKRQQRISKNILIAVIEKLRQFMFSQAGSCIPAGVYLQQTPVCRPRGLCKLGWVFAYMVGACEWMEEEWIGSAQHNSDGCVTKRRRRRHPLQS